MAPLIPPGSFVQIDAKQTRVKKSLARKSPGQSQFRRPIYFVDIRDGYACGWCQIEEGQLTLVPHPDSPEKIRTFRHPAEAEIVGRVTGIAMRINGEDLVALDESFGGARSGQEIGPSAGQRFTGNAILAVSVSEFLLTIIAKMAKMAVRGADHAARPRSSGRRSAINPGVLQSCACSRRI